MARKDAKKIVKSELRQKCERLLETIAIDPYASFPPYEELVGDLQGYISRRINIQHRLVYKAIEDMRIIKILRMWTCYE